MRLRAIAFATSVLAPAAAFAGPSPESVMEAVGRLGARTEIVSLNAGTGEGWAAVMRGVGSGSPAWLGVVGPLKQGTDGAWTLDLRIAVSTALASNPAGALALVPSEFALGDICLVPLIEPTAEEAEDFGRNALAGLDAVSAGPEAPAAKACRSMVAAG